MRRINPFILSLVFCISLLAANASAADIYLGTAFRSVDLNELNMPAVGRIPANEDPTSGGGPSYQIGIALNDYVSLEGFYTKASHEQEYSVGEMVVQPGPLCEWIRITLFLGSGACDGPWTLTIDADADVEVEVRGINAIYRYNMFYLKAGVFKWNADVDISYSSFSELPMVEDSSSGIGGIYGIGISSRGKHWRFFMDIEYEHAREYMTSGFGLGLQYHF